MKIDQWMPFFGDKFFSACEGRSTEFVSGYIRALWYYWSHTHCEGLEDDDDFLRILCRCDKASWARTKGLIFDGKDYFAKQDGKWHQKRNQELYQERSQSYEKKAEAAERARLGKLGVSPNLSPKPSPNNTANANCASYSYSSSDKIEEDGVVTLPPPNPKPTGEAEDLPPPDYKEVNRLLAYVKDKFGLPERDTNTERIRANIAECLSRGYKPHQLEEIARWAKAPHGMAGCPQSACSATEAGRIGQWLTTMENHATKLELDKKRRNK